MRILLVEDNPGDRVLIHLALRDAAAEDLVFELEHVERLAPALARLAQGEIDVVLLDLSLPDSSGVDTVRRVCVAAPHVPIVVLTGLDDQGLGIEAVQGGAQDYLVKGQVSGSVLVRAIRYARERREHEAQRERATRAAAVLEAARTAAEEGHRRSSFLAEASRVLAASLDEETTYSAVARLSVPYLAEICVLDVVDVDGATRRIAAVDADAVPAPVARAVERAPPRPEAPVGPARAMRTGRSEMGGDALEALMGGDPAHGPAGIAAPEWDAIVHTLHGSSCMIVPLVGRESVRGALTFVSVSGGRRHTAPDLALAEHLACRVGLAIENARLYRIAQEAIRARDEFLAVASHELYTPITSLQLLLQHSLKSLVAPAARGREARVDQLVGVADRQLRRLADLIGKLLDVSRIHAGLLRLDLEEVDLAAVAGDVVAGFREDLERARCPTSLEARTPVLGRWDRGRVEQIVTNLVSNAIKYGAGRPIEISVERDDGIARMRVTDHGIGIPPERLRHIFERFERFDGATPVRSYGGLGLGLHIVRQLLDLHGGTVRVESVVGQGSVFTVELPCGGPGLGERDATVGVQP